ncbi:MAG: hydroxysqualene dehydroxylase HpnE [Betaproteobacteria bacterium]
MTPLRVAVIGGGWAGLAAAVELSSAGAKVTVFEAAKQLGGRARRVEVNGLCLDNGQHILIGAYRDTLRLMQKVGADPEQLLKRLTLDLNYPGAGFRMKLPRLPAPLHLAVGLLGAKGCTLSEKFSAVRFMRALQASDYRLKNDCTVSEMLDQHQQHGKLRQFLWEPLCIAALNTAPENASAQLFANVLHESLGGSRAATDLLLPAADLSAVFPDAAARFITAHGGQIRLSTRIENLNTNLQVNGENFDQIILASAPQHASALLAGITETAGIATLLETYTYEPIGTAYLGYPPAVALPSPMTGLEGNEYGRLGQWTFDRGALDGQHGVISFVLSASGNWDQCDNQALANTLHHELEQTLGRTLPQPLWHQVIRERRATFSCRPNLPRPAAQTPLPGLWLAGDYVCAEYPATLEGAIRSGIAAAQGLLSG